MKILPLVFPVLLVLSGSFAGARSLPFAQIELVKVPGTRVSLVPPVDLKPSDKFPGFADEEIGLSIVVVEALIPYSEIVGGFTKEKMNTRVATLLSKREISLNGRPGILLCVKEEEISTAYLKWMVVTGNGKESVTIIATFPEEMETRWSSQMEKSVLSALWDPNAEFDLFESLDFSISDDPSLKFVGRAYNMVTLAKDGAWSRIPAYAPSFVIGSFELGAIRDVKEIAEEQLRRIADVSRPTIKKKSDVTISGLPGCEIIAEAQWKDLPDTPVTVYQVALLDKTKYFFMTGFAPREEREKYLAIFNRIAQSFRKK